MKKAFRQVLNLKKKVKIGWNVPYTEMEPEDVV